MTELNGGAGSLSERLVDELQRRILSGDVAVGSWLRHQDIAEEFGISRTPVREALRVLGARGIVTIVQNRGARVNGHSAAEIRELGQVRAQLEGYAAELAVERINDAQVAEMLDALERFSAAIEEYAAEPARSRAPDASARWAESNEQFHGAILRGSGNRQLLLSIADISRRLPRNSNYPAYAGNSRLLQQNLAEHQAVADAIVAGNAKKARAAMVKHICSAVESLARFIEDSERG